MDRYRSVKLWLHGLIAAFISSAAGSTAVMVIDPLDFNLGAGLKKLGAVALVMGLIGLFAYLKEHPVPDVDVVERRDVPPPPAGV
jgi:hypothetical protein